MPSAVRAAPVPEEGEAAFQIFPAVPRGAHGEDGVGNVSHVGHPPR